MNGGRGMSKHRNTDPACIRHSEPRTALGWWWFNRNRGKACIPCMKTRWARAVLKR